MYFNNQLIQRQFNFARKPNRKIREIKLLGKKSCFTVHLMTSCPREMADPRCLVFVISKIRKFSKMFGIFLVFAISKIRKFSKIFGIFLKIGIFQNFSEYFFVINIGILPKKSDFFFKFGNFQNFQKFEKVCK